MDIIYITQDNIDDVVKNDPVLSERDRICKEYCEKKGWPVDPEKLSFDQIFEIRELPEWKNAVQ